MVEQDAVPPLLAAPTASKILRNYCSCSHDITDLIRAPGRTQSRPHDTDDRSWAGIRPPAFDLGSWLADILQAAQKVFSGLATNIGELGFDKSRNVVRRRSYKALPEVHPPILWHSERDCEAPPNQGDDRRADCGAPEPVRQ